ncbi:hypothetical protein SAMN04489731_104162 [Amycolatopsis regifaucium]|nr:hypothetical protein SAMN04489731_104162 [Amycolatopsis regifaucium]
MSVRSASRELPDLSDARAADVIVDTFLRGFGAGEHQRGEVDNFGVGGIEPRSREKTARK